MLDALGELGTLEICILSLGPSDDEGRAATLATFPTAHEVNIPASAREALLRGRPEERDLRAIRKSLQSTLGTEDFFDVVWAYTSISSRFLGGWGARVRIVDLPDLPDTIVRRGFYTGSPRPGLIGRVSRLRWRLLAARNALRARRSTIRACASATLVVVCSEVDRQGAGWAKRVAVAPNGYELPQQPAGRREDGRPARTLMFQGLMTYEPNSDAAVFFAQEVLPMVREHVPDAVFRIVGKPGPEVLPLSGIAGVVVVGGVARIEDELAKADAVVVPLRVGSGTRLKILEAWAHCIPVVSTTVGAEGLPVSQGENVLVADSARALAQACVRVLSDEPLRERLAETGRRTAEARFQWADIQATLLAMIRAQLEG
jgi:glycosyltransferase involved in cell wall biosynthesis